MEKTREENETGEKMRAHGSEQRCYSIHAYRSQQKLRPHHTNQQEHVVLNYQRRQLVDGWHLFSSY